NAPPRARPRCGSLREGHQERAPCTRSAFDPQPPTVQLDERARDGQPKSSPTRRGARHTIEALEDALLLFRRNARALIRHRNTHLILAVLHSHPDATSRTTILVRISQNVAQDSPQPLTVYFSENSFGRSLNEQRLRALRDEW